VKHVLQNSDYSVKYFRIMLVPPPYYPSCFVCFPRGALFLLHTECLDRRFRREAPRTSGITSPNAHSIPPERMTRSVPISVRFTPPLSTSNMNRLGLDPSMILTLTIRRLRPWPLTLPESISSHTLFARADGCAWCHSDVVTARRQKSARTACIG
jgi:hypothetical protein